MKNQTDLKKYERSTADHLFCVGETVVVVNGFLWLRFVRRIDSARVFKQILSATEHTVELEWRRNILSTPT